MKLQVHVAWLLLLCVGASTARAQLGNVNFHNNFTPQGSSHKAFLTDGVGRPLPKGSWQLEVLDLNGALIKSGTLGADGLFFFGVIGIPGTQPGGAGVVRLRGWDNSTGSSYASAILKGMVLISLHNLGGGAIPPPPLGAAGDFLGGPFGPLTPPYTGPPTLFYLKGLQSHQLVADLPEGPSVWRLMLSGDLVHWTQVGEPQPGGWSRTWSVPNPESSTFFRVVQEPLAP